MRALRNRAALAIVTASLFAIMAIGCRTGEPRTESTPPPGNLPVAVTLTEQAVREIGLTTETARQRRCSRRITVPAKILANQDNEAAVGSMVRGRVGKVLVRVGDRVKAGQVLMIVESLEIGEIKAAFLLARANLAYRKSNLERQKKLLAENIGSPKIVLEAENEYEKARADYEAQKNRIGVIGIHENDLPAGGSNGHDDTAFGTLPVRSPITGTVIERSVVLGQMIEGTTDAFRIVNLGSVWIDGQVYEKDVDGIREHGTVRFVSPACQRDTFTGTITYLGQVIDEKTRTVTVRAEFDNRAGKLKPQMFGQMQIATGPAAPALLIPAEAVAKMENADVVFVHKGACRYEKRPVCVTAAPDGFAEITRGIAEGEAVVVKGSAQLKAELLKNTLGEGE